MDPSPQPPMDLIRVSARQALTGEVLKEVHVRPTDTVAALLSAIGSASPLRTSSRARRHRLLLGTRLLAETERLEDAGIRDGDVVDIISCQCIVASASADALGKIWSADTGDCLATLEGHQSALLSIALLPGGEGILSGSEDRTAKLWNTKTGNCLLTLEGHGGPVVQVACSSSGQLLLTVAAGMVRIWKTSSGDCLFTLSHTFILGASFGASFSHDCNSLLTRSCRSVQLWRTETWECTASLDGHHSSVLSAVFSQDSCFVVTASADTTAKLWCARTGQCLHTF
ncbi:unnamed protein product, partial [Polarella glacialis]